MNVLLEDLDPNEKYQLLTSCIVPRPIAWVSTISKSGVYNVAPFSYFTGVSMDPPLVLFAVERRHGEKKDTVINVEQTGEFVVNLVTGNNVSKMNITSKDFNASEDELAYANLTKVKSKEVDAPSIQESPLHMECVLERIIEIGSSPHSLVIGGVKAVTVDDEMVVEGRIQMDRLDAVGRMGGRTYTKANGIDVLFELPRLDWRKIQMNQE